jgi:hypothetical protein
MQVPEKGCHDAQKINQGTKNGPEENSSSLTPPEGNNQYNFIDAGIDGDDDEDIESDDTDGNIERDSVKGIRGYPAFGHLVRRLKEVVILDDQYSDEDEDFDMSDLRKAVEYVICASLPMRLMCQKLSQHGIDAVESFLESNPNEDIFDIINEDDENNDDKAKTQRAVSMLTQLVHNGQILNFDEIFAEILDTCKLVADPSTTKTILIQALTTDPGPIHNNLAVLTMVSWIMLHKTIRGDKDYLEKLFNILQSTLKHTLSELRDSTPTLEEMLSAINKKVLVPMANNLELVFGASQYGWYGQPKAVVAIDKEFLNSLTSIWDKLETVTIRDVRPHLAPSSKPPSMYVIKIAPDKLANAVVGQWYNETSEINDSDFAKCHLVSYRFMEADIMNLLDNWHATILSETIIACQIQRHYSDSIEARRVYQKMMNNLTQSRLEQRFYRTILENWYWDDKDSDHYKETTSKIKTLAGDVVAGLFSAYKVTQAIHWHRFFPSSYGSKSSPTRSVFVDLFGFFNQYRNNMAWGHKYTNGRLGDRHEIPPQCNLRVFSDKFRKLVRSQLIPHLEKQYAHLDDEVDKDLENEYEKFAIILPRDMNDGQPTSDKRHRPYGNPKQVTWELNPDGGWKWKAEPHTMDLNNYVYMLTSTFQTRTSQATVFEYTTQDKKKKTKEFVIITPIPNNTIAFLAFADIPISAKDELSNRVFYHLQELGQSSLDSNVQGDGDCFQQ